MRKKIIAGNWKMNKTLSESLELVNVLKDSCNTTDSEVVFCVPDINLKAVKDALEGTNIFVGAQNMHFEESGAFTGETSVLMLKDLGVKHVILGHSERRQYFSETCESVNKKTLKALEHGLTPIVCVGESLEDRQQNVTLELISMQVKRALNGVSDSDIEKVVIAYEPIWAIGTGVTATTDQAEEVCENIRKTLKSLYGDNAEKVRIQYGGSVNADNAKELFSKNNIDGGLVGGASLKADFAGIVNYK